MFCSKDICFRFTDAIFLAFIFLFQSIILNYFIISHFRENSLAFLWFILDLMCLLTLFLTLWLAYRNNYKQKKREKSLNLSSSNSVNSGRTNSRNSDGSDQGFYPKTHCFSEISKLPFSYISWIFYSVVLIAKLVVLFKAEIPQTLPKAEFFGPQLLKFSIGCTALLFSSLVEAHHDAHDDDVRHDYIKSISYGMALEIFDSTSFLGLLIGSDSHLVYTYKMENFVIALASINLMLPAIAMYQLTVSNFGRSYDVPLGALYKTLHLLLVNVPYLGLRIYLWQFFAAELSIFVIKNIYCIVSYVRELYPALCKLRRYYLNRARVVRHMPKMLSNGKLEEMPMGQQEDSPKP